VEVEQAEKAIILKILAGSHIHGLNVETSDRDEEAIIIEPIELAFGLHKPFEELIRESPECDVKYVSLRKWCQLALKGNPNFLLALFAPQSHIIKADSRGSVLRSLRHQFISKQAIKSHLGYMKGQRERMLKAESNDGRGKPRQDLTEQFGYDTKFAMHLIRLGFQGVQLAASGRIDLPIPEDDRQFMLRIRRGEITLEQVLRSADEMERTMKACFDQSKLPDQPNYAAVESWMLDTYMRTWGSAFSDMMLRRHQAWVEGGRKPTDPYGGQL
jgi:predicted nucleotidyltransferase